MPPLYFVKNGKQENRLVGSLASIGIRVLIETAKSVEIIGESYGGHMVYDVSTNKHKFFCFLSKQK